jgi:hypothetical protein
MKKLIGFTAVLVALFLSSNVFANGFVFELNGKKYEAAPQDLYGYYTFKSAKSACEGLTDSVDLNSDWFFPSKEELNAMYEQLHKKGLGGFDDIYYWGSSEHNGNYAWGQSFFDGFQYGSIKGCSARVRCVRAL